MATLYVMPVPLSLKYEDISKTSLNALSSADFVIGEERKNTLRLLAAADFRGKPYFLINEHTTSQEKLELAHKASGVSSVCFFSDGGTPCVSDPGYDFVDMCHELKVTLKPLGVESSILSALSVSGFYAEKFNYAGFPPHKGDSRRLFFRNIFKDDVTTVFLERPYALKKLLEELENCNKRVFIIFNIGMPGEHYFRGHIKDVIKNINKDEKSPFVVVLEGHNV